MDSQLKLLLIGESLGTNPELRGLAEGDGYELQVARSALDAVVELRAQNPTVVLVEHRVGGQSGVQVVKDLRRAGPSCEVIVVTDHTEFDGAIEALRAGAFDYIQLPIEVGQLKLTLARAEELIRRRQPTGPQTILVVEDHEATRASIRNVLRKEGYRVFEAADGVEALALFGEHRIDVIFSDLMMPKKGGLELLDDTKGAGADVEVIVATGHRDEGLVVAAMRRGAINFLKKPLEIEHVLLAIERAFEHLTLRRHLAARDRELQLMQQLVLRLTDDRELIVERPKSVSADSFEFLHQLVDTLPFGIVVFDVELGIRFANRQVVDRVGLPTERVSAKWLAPLGLAGITDVQLREAVKRTFDATPGHVETVVVGRWAFVLLTCVRVVTPTLNERCIAMAIRGERRQEGPAS